MRGAATARYLPAMSIDDDNDLLGLTRIGRIVGETLKLMAANARPGITTAELDDIGAREFARHGARSAPMLFKDFPGANCISLNDAAVHGIPNETALRPGDTVKLDVTGELDGYVADSALTLTVPPVSDKKRRIARAAEEAFWRGCHAARAGRPIYEIGRAVDSEVRRHGFTVLRELHSHGVGRAIHEEPSVPMYMDRRANAPLAEGLVITIEPIISAGSPWVATDPDGWTLRTVDGSLSAHYEHTIVITKDRPIVITRV